MSLNKKELSVEFQLKLAQIDLLYRQNIIGLVALMAYGLSYILFQWYHGPSTFLIFWGAVLFSSAFARVVVTYRWRQIRESLIEESELRFYMFIMSALLAVSGACWGVIGWYIPQTEVISMQLITALVVILMAAGGIVAYSASWFAPLAVFVPSLLPWTISSFVSVQPEHKFMGIMLLLYLCIGFVATRNWYLYVQKSLKLNIENSLMAKQLGEQIRLLKEQEDLVREKNEHEAASRAKSVFLANVSHEIRTPLSAINGFADLLLQNDKLDTTTRQDLQMVLRNGKYLVSLVNDLLDLSKIETGQIYIEKNKISPLQELEDVLALLRPQVEARGLKLEIDLEADIPHSIEGDATRFREILINLLNNASKYTESGSLKVLARYKKTGEQSGVLSIRVRDTGIGISLTAQKRLFRPFVRGDSEVVQRSQGSGLGLALSKKLARLMDGELELIHSKEGEGTEFEFSLQVKEIPDVKLISNEQRKADEAEVLQPSVRQLEGCEILVVDDSVDLQLLMRRFLERHGAHVMVLGNGLEAVEHLKNAVYDVVLMDIKMPVMDGYLAAAQLRKNSYAKPLVAVTAHANSDDRQLCYQSGFDFYISKPVTFRQLGEMIGKIVSSDSPAEFVKTAP